MSSKVHVEWWGSAKAWWRVAAVSALFALGLVARDAAAQSWVLQSVIEPLGGVAQRSIP